MRSPEPTTREKKKKNSADAPPRIAGSGLGYLPSSVSTAITTAHLSDLRRHAKRAEMPHGTGIEALVAGHLQKKIREIDTADRQAAGLKDEPSLAEVRLGGGELLRCVLAEPASTDLAQNARALGSV